MKWLFLLIYTIAFNSGNSDSSSPVSKLEQVVRTATGQCITDFTTTDGKVYRAKDGYGIKMGTTSVKGDITLQLDATYTISTMTIWAAPCDVKDSSATGFTVCGKSIAWQSPRLQLKPYTIPLNQDLSTISISANRASYGRLYVSRIEFEANDPMPNRAKITMPSYDGFKFESMEYDAESPAEDQEVFSVEARSVNQQGLSLSMKNGSIFHITPSSLPATGGDFEVSYTYSAKGYNLTDEVIISGCGADGQTVSHSFPVTVTIYEYTPKPQDSTGMQISIAPGTYYAPAQNLRDSALKTELGRLICRGIRYRYGSGRDHTWAGFWYTDRDTLTNRVLDMYSNEEHYFNPDKPAASVGGFDIEHMLPKSWWGRTVNKAYCDLFHLVPGNSSANRSKSNHAPGIVADSTFWNGSFATGPDAIHGLSRVFCPADEYKGDFARAYFYIACAYGDSLTWVQTAGSDPAAAMTNDSWQEFRPWLRDLLLQWHRMDPVGDKEKARAIEVNRIQGNRNPFIDYPELVEYIWGDKQGLSVDFNTLKGTYDNPFTNLIQSGQMHMQLKVLQSGQILILRDGKTYTILGAVVR